MESEGMEWKDWDLWSNPVFTLQTSTDSPAVETPPPTHFVNTFMAIASKRAVIPTILPAIKGRKWRYKSLQMQLRKVFDYNFPELSVRFINFAVVNWFWVCYISLGGRWLMMSASLLTTGRKETKSQKMSEVWEK